MNLSRALFGGWFLFIYSLKFLTFDFIFHYFILFLIYTLQFIVIPITQTFAAVWTVVKMVPRFKQIAGYFVGGICSIIYSFVYFYIYGQSIRAFMDDGYIFFLMNEYGYSYAPFWSVIFIISSVFGSFFAIYQLKNKQDFFDFLLEQNNPE